MIGREDNGGMVVMTMGKWLVGMAERMVGKNDCMGVAVADG